MSKDLQAADYAKWLVNHADREAGEVVTHLKLQKLLYFAQAYHLANFNKALFKEDFEAWTHGPVVPEVWHKFRKHGFDSIPRQTRTPRLTDETADFMRAVLDKFGSIGAKRLEKITHEHAPWREARGNLPEEASCSTVIRKVAMRDFYANRIGKEWTGRKIGYA
ncbi:MAG: DUF4065 domain-containing protein [Methylomonas sp.]|nr:DUF4065 domain-containing protein [Methylomonas sp.]